MCDHEEFGTLAVVNTAGLIKSCGFDGDTPNDINVHENISDIEKYFIFWKYFSYDFSESPIEIIKFVEALQKVKNHW